MSAQGRKWEHVEPRDIAGADLPGYVRDNHTRRGINAADRLATFGAGILIAALWINWDAIAEAVWSL